MYPIDPDKTSIILNVHQGVLKALAKNPGVHGKDLRLVLEDEKRAQIDRFRHVQNGYIASELEQIWDEVIEEMTR